MTNADLNFEFKLMIKDIAQFSLIQLGPFDRVRCCEWVRKLAEFDPTAANLQQRNDYAHFLRIHVKGGVLHGPFKNPPPHGPLIPLQEALCNHMVSLIPDLPKPGPIEPILCRKTENGEVYISVKKLPQGGIMCYMACSPDTLPQRR